MNFHVTFSLTIFLPAQRSNAYWWRKIIIIIRRNRRRPEIKGYYIQIRCTTSLSMTDSGWFYRSIKSLQCVRNEARIASISNWKRELKSSNFAPVADQFRLQTSSSFSSPASSSSFLFLLLLIFFFFLPQCRALRYNDLRGCGFNHRNPIKIPGTFKPKSLWITLRHTMLTSPSRSKIGVPANSFPRKFQNCSSQI